jgi:GntR family transcriptional regulator, transcriptional repressor for pyruvate dehydrogenase complex
MAQPAQPRRLPRTRPDPIDLPGIAPVTSTRLSDDLAGQIRRLIISAGISEGARLPSERDLAERFGASRPTVSQALRTLALMGLVEIRRGSGAYVLRRPETMVTASVNLMLDLDERSVSDLMRLRLWLETLGAEHAASREPALRADEVDAILAALDELGGAAGDTSAWIAKDTVFHASVVRSADNPYLTAMYESVHTAVLSYEYKHWVEAETVPAWLRHTSAAEQRALHEPISRAVIERDADAARDAVLKHHEVMSEHLAAARKPTARPRA